MLPQNEITQRIKENVVQGRVEAEDEGFDEGWEGQPATRELIMEALDAGIDPKTIVLDGLSQAMEIVGKRYETGIYLIPDMLASAEAVGGAMDLLAPHLERAGVESKGKFVLATVAGDLHDIGKNIVAIMLKGAGYEIIDLGADVPTERIVRAADEEKARYIGLSALLTTTMMEMERVIEVLKERDLRSKVKVLIGGAATSPEFAQRIGADAHCRDAFQAIDILEKMGA